MKILILLLFISSAVSARPHLPIKVLYQPSNGQHSQIMLRFFAPARDIVVRASGSGSVSMSPREYRQATLAAKQEVVLPLDYKVQGQELGTLVLEIQGNFGRGLQSEVRSFDVVVPPALSEKYLEKSQSQLVPRVHVLPNRTKISP